MSFDIERAISHARLRARPTSRGECATYTRQAIEAGGIRLDRTPHAKNYGASLERAGFVRVSTPRRGDVVVIQAPSSCSREESCFSGHMAIFDGISWVSDYVQRELYPGPRYRQDRPSYYIYRYGGDHHD